MCYNANGGGGEGARACSRRSSTWRPRAPQPSLEVAIILKVAQRVFKLPCSHSALRPSLPFMTMNFHPPALPSLWELADTTSTNFLEFFTPSPLSAFGSDLYNKIHATSLTTSAFP